MNGGVAALTAARTRCNDDLICALLRGEAAGWTGGEGGEEVEEFLSRAEYHGVMPLLDDRFRSEAIAARWPEAIRERCRADALSWLAWDMAQRLEVTRMLARLREAGIRPLVLKGGALAYTLYPQPGLRPRGDIDLLVAPKDRVGAEEALHSLGYARKGVSMGDAISQESTWILMDRLGASHAVDLHWRPNNSPVLAKLLDYDEMMAGAIGVPPLGPDAFTPGPVHALLFACIHRAGHANAPIYVDGIAHPAKDCLIWLYDIHLLASGMTSPELEEVAALAVRKRMTMIVHEALALCESRFGLELPPSVRSQLAQSDPNEPSARFFCGGRLRQTLGDLLALDGMAARMAWLREFAFPSAQYMRAKYAGEGVSWLPVLYTRRAISGLWKLLN